jgi:hypothetical protein
MTDEKFYNITSWNNKNRIILHRIVAILFMYAVILVCQWLHIEWWVRYDWACVLASLGYVFYLISIGHETQGISIFRDRHQRLQDYADYSEAPYFADSFHNYYAPIRNGDYVVLSNNEYLKLNCYSVFIGKDIDLNNLYSMTVKLLDGDKTIYEIKRNGYDYNELLSELYQGIKENGLDIEVIYNKFGDLKWRKNEQFRKKSRARQYWLNIYQVIWPTLQFFIAILPVLFMLFKNKTIWN